MSRGPGRIERKIVALLFDDPDAAWTVDELVERIYGFVPIRLYHAMPVERPRCRPKTGDEIHAIQCAAENEGIDGFISANSEALDRSHAARVAIARAGRKAASRPRSRIASRRSHGWNGGTGRGYRLVFYRVDRVRSQALAATKEWPQDAHRPLDDADARASIPPGWISDSSWCHRAVAIWQARHDGNEKLAAKLEAEDKIERARERDALVAAISNRYAGN